MVHAKPFLLLVSLLGVGSNQLGAASDAAGGRPTNACAAILAPVTGGTAPDRDIQRLQAEIAKVTNAGPRPEPVEGPSIERLGWLFIGKARGEFDDVWYERALQCADCLDSRQPGGHEAALLRGHVFHSLHRFKDGEPLARRLTVERGLSHDFALLGDLLMEQGKLGEAVSAYQTMADLKPDPHGFARIAHVRWLKGDLAGALEMMRDAARSGSGRDAESSAWMHARLAVYEFQSGHDNAAWRACDAALGFQSYYPPALLVRGRMLLAEGQVAEAIEPLRRAASRQRLPEYQWALAEAWRASGNVEQARQVESELATKGLTGDPRTLALYLATRRENVDLAVTLATHELRQRTDVHTHDALAWALAASDRWEEASKESALALAEGTPDARLLLHAGVIALRRGQMAEARLQLAQAGKIQQMLLPSERERLEMATRQLGK